MEKRENFSRKRTAVLNVLRETRTHPTADWVHAQLKPRYPNLSLGTVYRNLRKLCDTGKAASVGVINGQEHFDGHVEPHAHLVCVKCGAVLDVPGDFFEAEELRGLSLRTGCDIQSVSVLFRGVCPACGEGPGAER